MNTSLSPIHTNFATGDLSGPGVIESKKTIGDLHGVFADEAARASMDATTLAYRVQMHAAVKEGTPGGLFFGTSYVSPGTVGNEYFMTRGHFHAVRDRAEYYWCITGSGFLLLMDENRKYWTETLTPGSVHYIGGLVAHRLVNTGDDLLTVGACWPSDAGHDYGTIAEQGFSVRVVKGANGPEFLAQP